MCMCTMVCTVDMCTVRCVSVCGCLFWGLNLGMAKIGQMEFNLLIGHSNLCIKSLTSF